MHLTYCSNIHPGESWPEVLQTLERQVPQVKARVSPDAPMGVGLRLSARAARELLGRPTALPALRSALDARGLYVFTLNGFPYGPFHGHAIKQAVYRPDWCEPARAAYSADLFEILGALLPDAMAGSVSTVPGGFRPDIDRPAARLRMREQLLRCAADLWRREQDTGRAITLALEPEPHCMLETTEEAVAFFESTLLGPEALERMAALIGATRVTAEAAIRRHLGLCLDTCHAAVEFEDPRTCVDRIAAAGLRLAKVQITAALVLDPVTDEAVARLQPFDDGQYLHQVVARDDHGRLHRFLDLDDAIRSRAQGHHRPVAWRVHFHVPIFHDEPGPLSTTADSLAPLLAQVHARGLSPHFEVETYTWGVLPPSHRTLPLADAIARELTTAAALLRHTHGASRECVA
ncbi:MAG: metabolite traffic protein EboE [Deltaproteobacteria bacterium]|nr:metabolite traffic protein EboE [Deltaproteobacteria bacterium]